MNPFQNIFSGDPYDEKIEKEILKGIEAPNSALDLRIEEPTDPFIYIRGDTKLYKIPENKIDKQFKIIISKLVILDESIIIYKKGIFTGTWDRWYPDNTFDKITLPNCKYFSINNFMIEKIPLLPECIYFSCRDCDILQELPLLPKCLYLDCNGCTALKRIPESDKIIYINFDKCRNLEFTREFANKYNARLIREITPEMEILGITELPEAIPESMILQTGGTIPLECMLNKKLTMYPFLLNL